MNIENEQLCRIRPNIIFTQIQDPYITRLSKNPYTRNRWGTSVNMKAILVLQGGDLTSI